MNIDLLLSKYKAKFLKAQYFKKIFGKTNPTHKEVADYFEKNKRGADKDKVVRLDKVGKIYSNGFKAVHNFNLEIQPKEFVAFLGPSGCGKTTILRMIAGLEYISEGELSSNGVVLNAAKPSERSIAMVFQNYALYPYMNVYNNIAFGLKLKTTSNPLTLQYSRILKELKKPGSNEIANLKHLIFMLKNPLQDERKELKKEIKKLKKVDRKSTIIPKLKNQLKILKEEAAKQANDNQSQIEKTIEKINSINEINKSPNHLLDKEIKELQKQDSSKNQKKLESKIKEMDKLKEEHKKLIKNIKEKMIESMILWNHSIPERVRRITEMIGIDNYLHSKPMELSGGQRQRVALARSISRDADIFLYDEPLSNLDAKLRVTMRVEVRKLHDMLGSISIYVTHDQVEAMSMADKIVVINKGYIQQVGTPKEMFDSPANLFVATFIGTPSINKLEATLTKTGTLKIKNIKFEFNAIKERAQDIKKHYGKNVFLCFRPQDIELAKKANSKAANQITGKVIIKEMLGYEHSLVIQTKDLGEINIVVNKNNNISVGDTVSFGVKKQNIHLFDKKTEISLTSKFNKETSEAHKVMLSSEVETIKNDIVMQKQKNNKTIGQKGVQKAAALFSQDKSREIKEEAETMKKLVEKLRKEIKKNEKK